MIRLLCLSLVLAGVVQWTRAADQSLSEEARRGNAALAAGSNAPPAIPQLSANPATESEIQSHRIFAPAPDTNAPASPVKRTVPQIESVTFFVLGGMIGLLVIVAITGRRPKE